MPCAGSWPGRTFDRHSELPHRTRIIISPARRPRCLDNAVREANSPPVRYPDLKGKVVLLTGGANGIGAASVRALREQGARVFFCDVDAVAGKALERELGGEVQFSRVDLTKEKEINQWVERTGKRLGVI